MSEHPATLVGWFDRAAAQHPRSVALIAGGTELTYSELDAAVTGLAERLGAVTAPAARVGIVAARTVDTYVAYLAVLRAGCTAVPLNEAFPASRTRQMLQRAQAQALLGPAEALGRLELGWGAVAPIPATGTALRLAPSVAPVADGANATGAAAYILFTSGTTGAPKGISISQANAHAFLKHVLPAREIGPGDRASQCFDLTFDPSVFDMFTTWGAGATLVVPSRAQLRNPAAFVGEFGITHWSSVPSVISLAARMRQLSPGAMPSLRSSCFAGEALTLSQARSWQAAAPGSRIWNAYGPTELTITCSAYQLPADVDSWPATRNGTVPIGAPYPGVRWRIDASGGTADQAGELWLSGPQRFDGYLDPADNVGRFTSYRDDSMRRPGADAYFRTGDSVAETADGLVHLGRLDHQVQVNGYRVELSEVEGALRSHPAVDDAVAFLRDGELVAVHTGAAADAGAILDAVADRLPPYMVPSRLERKPDLPLNDNGKIDRNLVAAREPATR